LRLQESYTQVVGDDLVTNPRDLAKGIEMELVTPSHGRLTRSVH
jgi:hypothetical protein